MEGSILLRGSTRETSSRGRPRPLTTYGELAPGGDQVTGDPHPSKAVTRQQEAKHAAEISPDHSVKSAHAEKEVH